MSVRPLLPVLALSLGFALACTGGMPTTAPPPPPPPAVAVAPGMTGVPACDDYIKKMEACLATQDAATRSAMEAGFKASKDAWIQAASTEAGKTAIAQACTAAAAVPMAGCGETTTTTTTTTTADGATTTATTTTDPKAEDVPADAKATDTKTTTETTATDTKTTTETKATEPAERTRRPSGSGGVTREGGSSSSGSSSGSSDRKGGVKR